MRKVWQSYGLSITLFFLFLFSWIAQGYFQWEKFAEDQKEHQQPVQVEQFIPEFLTSTFENWQSEFLQLLTFVVLTSFLNHKGSPESKESDERMQRSIDRIESAIVKKRS